MPNTAHLSDQHQRATALDTGHSFIVHAPAGSGKTELLIQRYVSLLSQSAVPESVLALTFTRKAAQEMRERVMEILALHTVSVPPAEPHQRKRWELGKKLYAWQAQRQWRLLDNMHHLQIQTIDAFYAQLVQSNPLASGWIATAKLAEDPEPLYREAVQQLLLRLEEPSGLREALIQLMRHLNNDTPQIERLLIHLLKHRDQWISLLPQRSEDIFSLRDVLERSLKVLRSSTYQEAEELFSACTLTGDASLREIALARCALSVNDTLSPEVLWHTLSEVFLTTQGKWRRQVREPRLESRLKQSVKQWLAVLADQEPLRLALLAVRHLPPANYNEAEWALLKDLFYVLNALLAILKVIYQQQHQVDYIELALAASRLLGSEESPSTLLLRLDYQVQHILMDEFQDTSLQQLKFLKLLTAGWQANDGRTVFIVGDPMQSIYRFRKAEARLFTWVKQYGFGDLPVEPLTLSTNFRSAPYLVKWANQKFSAMQHQCLAKTTEKELFTPSISDSDKSGCVVTHWLSHATIDQEAAYVMNLVKLALESAGTAPPTIAILGRTRQQLLAILAQLRQAKVAYQAIDIETLVDKAVIQDLMALTRALTHLGDDVAWLALLRAPWCGVSLTELHTLRQCCQRYCPPRLIWEQLQAVNELALSYSAEARLNRLVRAIRPSVESQGRLPLVRRVLEAWYALGGPATQPVDSWYPEDIDRFCQCVQDAQIGETLVDNKRLVAKLSKVYATSPLEKPSVTLMTIHKAKGLEFDQVILTGLHKGVRHQPHSLILFDESFSFKQQQLLLAPIQGNSSEANAIYDYLRQIDNQHYQAEVLRLLYVACTRAKQVLHLVASVEVVAGKSFVPYKASFLSRLWPVLENTQKKLITYESVSILADKRLKRMTLDSLYPIAPEEP